MLLDEQAVEYFKCWFADYVSPFKTGPSNDRQGMTLKEEHTLRVCHEIRNLGTELGLQEEALYLAELTALFHDIGRFAQYARYQTYLDSASEDHGDLGADILRSTQVLKELDASARDLIIRAVSYHNKASLPDKETEPCLYFTKLLRDADKLDILRVVTDYYRDDASNRNEAIELYLPDTPGISPPVYDDLMNRRIVSVMHLKNQNDFRLLQLGWVYDINFVPTLRTVLERGYLEMIRDYLPATDEISSIYSVIEDYIQGKIRS